MHPAAAAAAAASAAASAAAVAAADASDAAAAAAESITRGCFFVEGVDFVVARQTAAAAAAGVNVLSTRAACGV